MTNDSHLFDAVANVGIAESPDRPAGMQEKSGKHNDTHGNCSTKGAVPRAPRAGRIPARLRETPSDHGHFHVLASLSARTRSEVLNLCMEVRLKRADVLWNQGDPDRSFGFVKKGVVAGVYNSPSGKTGLTGFWRDGDAIGTSSGTTRMVTAMALTRSSVLTIERESFFEAVRSYPDFAEAVVHMAFERLRWAGELIFSHETESTTQRLATILIALLDSFGKPARTGTCIDVPLTNDMLAALVGASRQFVNSILHKLQDAHVLELRRTSILVLDRQQLEELSV